MKADLLGRNESVMKDLANVQEWLVVVAAILAALAAGGSWLAAAQSLKQTGLSRRDSFRVLLYNQALISLNQFLLSAEDIRNLTSRLAENMEFLVKLRTWSEETPQEDFGRDILNYENLIRDQIKSIAEIARTFRHHANGVHLPEMLTPTKSKYTSVKERLKHAKIMLESYCTGIDFPLMTYRDINTPMPGNTPEQTENFESEIKRLRESVSNIDRWVDNLREIILSSEFAESFIDDGKKS